MSSLERTFDVYAGLVQMPAQAARGARATTLRPSKQASGSGAAEMCLLAA